MIFKKLKNQLRLLNAIHTELEKRSAILTKLDKIQESIGRLELRQLEELDRKKYS